MYYAFTYLLIKGTFGENFAFKYEICIRVIEKDLQL